MSRCYDCPRLCGADREAGEMGLCRSPYRPVAARAAAHFGEEPCISGTRGSGAIFFTGCSLGCVYCQNAEIAQESTGIELTTPQLRDVFLRLRDQGVHNINLVTPSHFVRPIAEALDGLELGIPVCWNSSGYENLDSLKRLEGLVQIYMPDLKYTDPAAALKYSGAPDYPAVTKAAILEMFRQVGPYRMDENDILQSGVIVRHLILPGFKENSFGVIDWTARHFPSGEILFSLMSQYTPMPGIADLFPELSAPVTQELTDAVYNYMLDAGIEAGYYQDVCAAGADMIPAFDGTGLSTVPGAV